VPPSKEQQVYTDAAGNVITRSQVRAQDNFAKISESVFHKGNEAAARRGESNELRLLRLQAIAEHQHGVVAMNHANAADFSNPLSLKAQGPLKVLVALYHSETKSGAEEPDHEDGSKSVAK